jgi:hypothetical protein
MTRVKQYWIYVLLCRDGSFYTGVTSMLEKRIAQHHHGEHAKKHAFVRGDWGELRRLSRGAVRDGGPSTSSG